MVLVVELTVASLSWDDISDRPRGMTPFASTRSAGTAGAAYSAVTCGLGKTAKPWSYPGDCPAMARAETASAFEA